MAGKCWLLVGTERLDAAVLPKFGLLHDILIYKDYPLFIVQVSTTICLNPIYHAFEVQVSSPPIYKSLFCTSLKHERYNAVKVDGHMYVKSKFDLDVFLQYYVRHIVINTSRLANVLTF